MTLQIDADVPAGNVILERIEGDDVYFRPDLRDTEGHWFYWHFRLRGGAGRSLTFHITSRDTLTEMGPAVSYDAGRTWRWLGPSCVGENWTFRFDCPADADDVLLSMGMTYTHAHWRAFTDRFTGDPRLHIAELCRSRRGRIVEQAVIGDPDIEPAYRLLLTARHHCCEAMASYALEGLLEAALSDDELGQWFGRNVRILAIPLVDPDGVEAGDQGKNRRPRDHNRDYDATPIYPETAAIRQLFPTWAQAGPTMAMDLHCPWIHSWWSQTIYTVGSSDPAVWEQQCRFSQLLESLRTGPLPYAASDNLPFGQRWNVASNSSQGLTCSRWARALPNMLLSTTLEVPYAIARQQEVNQQTARALGHDLARAIRAYLSQTTPHA
ncbi:MAG: M14 family zinc carboxypeptidase [Phycisphaeraceae bacterium]